MSFFSLIASELMQNNLKLIKEPALDWFLHNFSHTISYKFPISNFFYLLISLIF